MSKTVDARVILGGLGLPLAQQNEISALTLLALARLKPADPWTAATRVSARISKDIMVFIREHYKKAYAANTRETIRRQVLHQFVQAQIAHYNPDDPQLATNSPNAHYALTTGALAVLHSFGTTKFAEACKTFKAQSGSLRELYEKGRAALSVPVALPSGGSISLSPGVHNELQAAVIEVFLPRFAPGAEVLYLGDTAKKSLHVDAKTLEALGIPITAHDKLPDIVLYDRKQSALLLIEVVTSHGPMTPKRIVELEAMLAGCECKKLYITAFPDFQTWKQYLGFVAWETEVWIAEAPDHMVHYNGDRFMQPR